MPDETPTETVTTPPPSETPGGNTQPTLEQLQEQLAEAQKSLKNKTEEAARHYKKLSAIEKADADKKAAEQSETEKLMARTAEAEKARDEALAKANARLIQSEVIAKASGMKFINPQRAVKLIDLAKVTVSDDGEVEGVEDALKELAKTDPYLIGKGVPTLNATNPGGNTGQGETVEQKRARLGLR